MPGQGGEMDVAEKLLREFDEINSYARHVMILASGWYAFFITSNLVGTGVVMRIGSGKAPLGLGMLRLVGIVFAVVNVLSIVATILVLRYYASVRDRLRGVSSALNQVAAESGGDAGCDSFLMKSPFPYRLHWWLTFFATISLILILGFWIAALMAPARLGLL